MAPSHTSAPRYYPPSESSGGWRRLVSANTTPTSLQKSNIRAIVGLDWNLLKQAWDASSGYGGTFLVIRNGWIAAEWGTSSALGIASCTKTLTSLAVHRIFDMSASGRLTKVIRPDDYAYRYLPSSWGSHSTRRTIRMRHLLTMSSGLQPDDNPPSPSGSTSAYEQKLLAPPVRTTPGKEWSYASLPVDVLSLVTENVTGLRLSDFFHRNIGSPIGLQTLRWAAFGNQHTYASAYSNISGRDLARVKYLLLHRGTWNTTSLVTGQSVDSMTKWASALNSAVYGPQVKFPTDPNSHKRYGRLVWTNRTQSSYVGTGVPADAYYCAGFRTNFAMVIPSLDLIYVRLQNGPAPWSDALFKSINTKVMSAVVGPGGNTPPTAKITSPTNGSTFSAGATITIAASATDPDGTVSSVAFYAGTTLLGTDAAAPYSISWRNVAAGSYALTARSTDNRGAVTISPTVNITVR